jgi:uncharacterized protein (TIGR00290 family)
MEKAFVSWSGGKDCCQSAYKAQQKGYQLKYLLNMVNPEVERSCSHGISSRWIKLQAEAMGIPILQPHTNGKDYEEVFINTLKKIKTEGVTTGIFGDIDFMPHLEWVQKICGTAGLKAVLPLWQGKQEQIAQDFIDLGFVSIIVAVKADLLGEDWLGRKFDKQFIKDIAALNKNITPCGEAGEFHSLVVDGPLFKKRLELKDSTKVRRQDHWFLDIKECEIVDKR